MTITEGLYKVSGRHHILYFKNSEWHWVPTEQAIFALGYSWDDVQTIDIATFCQYPIGNRVKDDGSGFTTSPWPGYIPDKDWYTAQCAIVPPPVTYICPHCGASFDSQAELDDHIATQYPPSPPINTTRFVPRILYGGGDPRQCAEIGINTILMNGFHLLTYSQRDAALAGAAKYGVKIIPWLEGIGCYLDPNCDPLKSGNENWWDEKAKLLTKYKDDERIYCWNLTQEPEVPEGWMTVEFLKNYYNFVRKYDPAPGKAIFILWDQWDAKGYLCQPGYYDLTTMDTWYSGGDNVEGLKSTLRHLDGYYCWRDIGKPVIAHFYGFTKLAECYRAWEEFFGERGVEVIGVMYYTADTAAKRSAIEAFHRSMGWWPPPEEFTTEEIICPGCGALLELTISSIPEKNISQNCPVCGTPAD